MSGYAAPRRIFLYDGLAPDGSAARGLAEWLQSEVKSARVEARPDFFRFWLEAERAGDARLDDLAARFARARVVRADAPRGERRPLPGEVRFERRFLLDGPRRPYGLLYDALAVMAIAAERLPAEEAGVECCHIALTNLLVGEWDPRGRRWRARSAVYGLPSFASAPGHVEAPAKPRAYYLARALGADAPEPGDSCLAPRDPRLPEAMKGALLQAVFYHMTGEPHCERRECRLFDAHWQADLLYAQTRPGAGLCERHRRMLEESLCA